MDKLKQLLSRCKCGVYLEVNSHRDYYQSPEKRLEEIYEQSEEAPEIADDVRSKMIESNTIIELQFYPDTPIGFYKVYHYDLDEAITLALKCISGEEKEKERVK